MAFQVSAHRVCCMSWNLSCCWERKFHSFLHHLNAMTRKNTAAELIPINPTIRKIKARKGIPCSSSFLSHSSSAELPSVLFIPRSAWACIMAFDVKASHPLALSLEAIKLEVRCLAVRWCSSWCHAWELLRQNNSKIPTRSLLCQPEEAASSMLC